MLGLAHLDRAFDYLVAEEDAEAVVPGVRVRVRFAGRLVDAIVLERVATSSHETSLRFIERVISPEVVAPARTRELARPRSSRTSISGVAPTRPSTAKTHVVS